ncbi:MAG TPA: hypothetical protein VIS48_10640 [Candidatus Kryptonia bacterium]
MSTNQFKWSLASFLLYCLSAGANYTIAPDFFLVDAINDHLLNLMAWQWGTSGH